MGFDANPTDTIPRKETETHRKHLHAGTVHILHAREYERAS